MCPSPCERSVSHLGISGTRHGRWRGTRTHHMIHGFTPKVRDTGVMTFTRWSHTVFQPITVRIASTPSRICPTSERG
eukprot:COSAG01_NODE_5111_length_4474_cov_1.654936_3_plen_77_part_00